MSGIDLSKIKGRQALLNMAKQWEDQGSTQHAIEAYVAVIEAALESKEADQARDALMEMAKEFEKQGKKHSAYHLYHKLAKGRAGSYDQV